MNFETVPFLGVFLPVVLIAHWTLPRRAAAQNLLLALASCLFFFTWTPQLLPLFLVTAGVNYLAAGWIGRLQTAEGDGGVQPRQAGKRRTVLLAVIAFDLLQLIGFKYLGFFARVTFTLLGWSGLHDGLGVPSLLLPLGISFWTLQLVGHQIDVHHGRVKACRSPLTFLAFVGFFPQLVAGPIARSDLLDAFAAPRLFDVEKFRTGAFRFLRGYVLRFLIAASLGNLLVDPVFAAPGQTSAAGHWMALGAYGLQVFADFAGYSEMAIGCALLFGIRLRENFDFPFLAGNLLEFWKRWHMSLTNWLFDYIYSPLVTGSGWMRGRLDLGFLVTFLVSGLWHGAAGRFVFWGALQGLGLVVHRRYDEWYRSLCRGNRAWVARRKAPLYRSISWVVTQGFFLLTLIPFRAPGLGAASTFFGGLFQGGQALVPLSSFDSANLAVCVALLVAWHAVRGRSLIIPAPVRGLVYGVLILYLTVFMPVAKGTFIYAQF